MKIRPHRQYRIDQRTGRPVRPGQLRCSQIRNSRIHQGAGAGRRCPGNYRQRDSAGLCQYRYGAGRAGGYSGKIIQRIPTGRLGQVRTLPAACCFLSPTRRISSPARRCRSMAGSICTENVRSVKSPDDRCGGSERKTASRYPFGGGRRFSMGLAGCPDKVHRRCAGDRLRNWVQVFVSIRTRARRSAPNQSLTGAG